MLDFQKEDLQFWFYNKIFVDKWPLDQAVDFAAKEVGVPQSQALEYLSQDQRILLGPPLALPPLSAQDLAGEGGIFVDLDWMVQILKQQAHLQGDSLVQAVQQIYKLSFASAQEELAALIPLDDKEGDL